jgi:hypothetical protein
MAQPLNTLIGGAVFALTAATAVAAYAQPAPGTAPAPAPGSAARAQQQADGDAARSDPTVRREERRMSVRDGNDHREMRMERRGQPTDMAEHLRTMLQLKPGQEPALQAYVAAVRPQHPDGEHMTHMADRDGDRAKTTPERLADMEKRMAENQAQAHVRIEATRRFYAQLEPAQKKVFDEMPMLMVGPIGPIGPMMMPGPMKIRFEHRGPPPPLPPAAPVPPTPPTPPRL